MQLNTDKYAAKTDQSAQTTARHLLCPETSSANNNNAGKLHTQDTG